MSKDRLPRPWTIPLVVQDVPPEGQEHRLKADATVRAAVAKLAGVSEVARLEASIMATPHGTDGLHVTGRVSATIGQICVVTLEPMQSEIDEAIDLLYLHNPPDRGSGRGGGDEEHGTLGDERIESLEDGIVDLGAVAIEFLILGIDPYPRKPGAIFAPPAHDEPSLNPFAVLEALKKAPSGRRG